MKKVQIAVIGGGASGLMAAIQAAYIGADVAIAERNPRIGKKILSTGNGKCNFSHRPITSRDYHGTFADSVETYLERFGVQDTLAFFERAGMLWKDKNGYLYPFSEQASVVAEVLKHEVERLGITVLTDCMIDGVRLHEGREKERFSLYQDGREILKCDKVIAAFGGMAAPATGSDGAGFQLLRPFRISCSPMVPALTKLVCADPCCKAIAGVRSDAAVTLYCGEERLAVERGEIQFTEYGLSGIPVFQISGTAAKKLLGKACDITCVLDLLPEMETEEVERFLLQKLRGFGRLSGEVFLNGLVNQKLSGAIGKEAGIRYGDILTAGDEARIRKFARLLKGFVFHVTGVKGFQQAQVTAGGVCRTEVTEDLEAVRVKGLFLAGELLDLDGRCGGFNLQWSFSSGAIAGRAAALSCGLSGNGSTASGQAAES